MNELHKKIRNRIRGMPTDEAISVIQAFHLPAEEELYVIECDVWKSSQISVSEKYNISPETVKRRRMAAYSRMAQQMESMK